MTSLARTRPSLRRAAFVAALGALMVPATAGASVHAHAAKTHKVKLPVVTRVAPLRLEIGQKLEIRGRNFLRGRNKNTVVFKRDRGKAVFVKADVGTRKLLRLTVPAKLQSQLLTRSGTVMPTLFRVRVLAKKFGKHFTKASRSPVIAPKSAAATGGGAANVEALPDGDCNHDGVLNRDTGDDDGDLLSDTLETQIGTDPCKMDSDGDGVEDGYEYRSAVDLNNDEYQDPNFSMPDLGKRPYPNPLDKEDANTDFDGDGLTLADEQKLWKYSTPAPRRTSLDRLSYSDGMKYSVYTHHTGEGDRRFPALAAAGYDKTAEFEGWLNGKGSGYATVYLPDANKRYSLLDVNRSEGPPSTTRQDNYLHSESDYLDTCTFSPSPASTLCQSGHGWLSDDERDEDADGLSNFVESHGMMSARSWWDLKYPREAPFRINYAGTDMTDEDTDHDGVRDGADDQDHDDIPNIMELSRNMATGRSFDDPKTDKSKGISTPALGRVNPFNPCLPVKASRTCPTYTPLGATAWAPFDNEAAGGDDPDYLVLN